MDANTDPTPAEMAERVTTYKFFYLRRVLGNRWVRDAQVINGALSLEFAIEMFRGHPDRDLANILLANILRGNSRAVDEFEYGDEPDFNSPHWQQKFKKYEDQAQANPSLLKAFTVIGIWDSETQNLSRPNRFGDWNHAIDALHAELIARSQRTSGTCLVSAVVENHICIERYDDAQTQYASIDGDEPPPLATDSNATPPTSRTWLPWAIAGAAITILLVILCGIAVF